MARPSLATSGGGGIGAILVRILSVVFVLIGATLTIGGAWLLTLGGSFYYLLAGLGLIASGVMMFRLRLVGAWIYVGVFVLTVLWAL
ncbi:MAG: hypothetical protein EBR82_02785, partial [Caulobacteraceae bacterium]|nr:hypothetical protein [Caulobacteraceae bacterium]